MNFLTFILCALFLITSPNFALAARDITVYAFHQPIEKIVTSGHGGNYPECALVSLVLTEIDPDTGKRIFYRHIDNDSPLEIKIQANSSAKSLYALSFIMDGSPLPFGTPSVDMSGDTPKWKGLFYGWGNCSASLPLDLDPSPGSIPTPETARHSLDLFTKATFSPVIVLTVYSWNYNPGAGSIQLQISAQQVGSSVKVENPNITVSLDMDNIDLVRQKVPAGQEATFHGDPGILIVKDGGKDFDGNDRTYNQIGQVICDIQRGRQVSGGGGTDWIQVAAADKYNNAYYNSPADAAVYNRVNKIVAKDMKDFGLAEEGVVYLNPYVEEIRFNKPLDSKFGFQHYHLRDGVISHEALHVYMKSAANGWIVENKEGDSLYVEGNGASKKYVIFSEDSRGRGFIKLSAQKKNYVEQYLNGESGDTIINKYYTSSFLEGLPADAAGALSTETEFEFLSQSAPKDLPIKATSVSNPELYAYKTVTGATDGSCFTISGLLQKPWTIEGIKTTFGDGDYYVRPVKFQTIGKKKREAITLARKNLSDLLKQGYGLYMGFRINYGFGLLDLDTPPEEFDAYYFGIGGR